MPTQRKAGRPKGSQTREVPTVPADKSRCRCGSTERSAYYNRRTLKTSGTHNGKPFNLVVWRRCNCSACGQARDDKTFELVRE